MTEEMDQDQTDAAALQLKFIEQPEVIDSSDVQITFIPEVPIDTSDVMIQFIPDINPSASSNTDDRVALDQIKKEGENAEQAMFETTEEGKVLV